VHDDPAVQEVHATLQMATRGDPAAFFVSIARQGIDEVLDGPRTGRCLFAELEKTEKTYVGTKLEILIRHALALEHGDRMDVRIAGHDVDIKWAFKSAWQIPREAVGELCLCIGGTRNLSRLQAGVVRCTPDRLGKGSNQDGKRTLSEDGRRAMSMLFEDVAFPGNFVARMDPTVRGQVMAHRTVQKRIAALARAMPYVPIPRDALCTVGRTTGDPMRRIRRDKNRRSDPLEGMVMLSSQRRKDVVAALGCPPLGENEFMAVPQSDIDALGL
jgi:hypothetical protein